MSFRRPAVVIAVAVTMHCGGNSNGGADAGFDATPVDAAPVDAAPVDAAPVDAAPVDAAPVDAAPVDAVPVDAALDAPPEPVPPCTGTLTFTQQAPLPGWSPLSLVAADINSDMHVDALVGTLGGDVRVFLGRGDGTFAEAPRVHVSDPRSIVARDFDGDAVLDIAVANHGTQTLQLWLGLGDGRFEAPPEPAQPVALAARPLGLVATDVDEDGDLDLATSYEALDQVAVARNLGDGMLGSVQTFPTFMTPSGLATTDVDLDGHADLIVSNRTDSAALLLGDGAGGFAAPTGLAFALFQLAISLEDLDGNGYGDLVLTSSNTRQLQLRLHDGASGFASPTTYDAGEQPVSVSAGDFDGDGDLDLVHLDYTTSTFTVRFAAPAGVFAASQSFAVGGFVQPRVVVAADLNHDAHADLLVARSGSDDVGVYLAGCQP